jgi:hypothetical protein
MAESEAERQRRFIRENLQRAAAKRATEEADRIAREAREADEEKNK